MNPLPNHGLYALTDPVLTAERGLVISVEQALRGGATLIQYRDKSAQVNEKSARAQALLKICRQAKVPLIINDDVELALAIGADGVHVGRDDQAVQHARQMLGSQAIVGASCYHQLSLATQAVRDGASYVAFGRFFESLTKPGQALANQQLLRAAKQQLSVPIAAIGGIAAENAPELVAAGTDFLAVIHDLWREDDCQARAQALSNCFKA